MSVLWPIGRRELVKVRNGRSAVGQRRVTGWFPDGAQAFLRAPLVPFAGGRRQRPEGHRTDGRYRAGRCNTLSPFQQLRGRHASVVVRVRITEEGAALAALRDQVVPQISQAPGFVAGYWTRKENTGLSMIVFASADAAQATSERIPGTVPEGVTLEDVEVREVVAHA